MTWGHDSVFQGGSNESVQAGREGDSHGGRRPNLVRGGFWGRNPGGVRPPTQGGRVACPEPVRTVAQSRPSVRSQLPEEWGCGRDGRQSRPGSLKIRSEGKGHRGFLGGFCALGDKDIFRKYTENSKILADLFKEKLS